MIAHNDCDASNASPPRRPSLLHFFRMQQARPARPARPAAHIGICIRALQQQRQSGSRIRYLFARDSGQPRRQNNYLPKGPSPRSCSRCAHGIDCCLLLRMSNGPLTVRQQQPAQMWAWAHDLWGDRRCCSSGSRSRSSRARGRLRRTPLSQLEGGEREAGAQSARGAFEELSVHRTTVRNLLRSN